MSATALGPDAPVRQAIVLVAGNPNSGKSTLFNALSGARTRVANYPGVTIERRSATLTLARGSVELTDLPGTYSLSARSPEEQIAVDSLLGRGPRRPDAILVVVDATALARALYLTLEILEIGCPVVIALNMTDEAERDGVAVDAEALEQLTGARVVPTVASRGLGMEDIRAALSAVIGEPSAVPPPPAIERPRELETDLAELEGLILSERLLANPREARAWAQWLLLSIDDDGDELRGVPVAAREAARRLHQRAGDAGRDLDLEIIAARYRHVDRLMDAVYAAAPAPRRSWTDRIDAVLTHRLGGAIAFALVMLIVFQALFSWSEPAIAAIEDLVTATQTLVSDSLPPGPLTSLIVDGVIAGVGNVVVFVPQIALLFLFIGLLEDLGYLARAAFVIDRVMRAVGLHGRAFVPMLSGFSCAVPAVMATRTLESRTDRLLTMMVLPLTSCSARLPVYVLVTATVFAPGTRVGWLSAGAVALFAMYALSVVAALAAAAVLRRTVLKGPVPALVLELPPYRLPSIRVLLRGVWQRVRTFLVDAGTVILALTVVLWALLSYPKDPAVTAAAADARAVVETQTLSGEERDARVADIDSRENGANLRYSVAGRVGHFIEPLITPLGFDWRIGVGILGAFAAREVFVGTLGVVFDIADADETNEPLRETLRAAVWPGGAPLMTPLAGISLMVFFVLACQCMSTVAVVRRESGTWRWPLFMVAYMTALAYTASLLVYQVGRLFGWGLG
ncbi:MAG: ferrous iron transport protein B [Acidobacteria bacterium]|nr:ferrous iron transport protein B [Acidobacteriota bacterium]